MYRYKGVKKVTLGNTSRTVRQILADAGMSDADVKIFTPTDMPANMYVNIGAAADATCAYFTKQIDIDFFDLDAVNIFAAGAVVLIVTLYDDTKTPMHLS